MLLHKTETLPATMVHPSNSVVHGNQYILFCCHDSIHVSVVTNSITTSNPSVVTLTRIQGTWRHSCNRKKKFVTRFNGAHEKNEHKHAYFEN